MKQRSCGIWRLCFPNVMSCIPSMINCAFCFTVSLLHHVLFMSKISNLKLLWLRRKKHNVHVCVWVHVCVYSLTFGVAGAESFFSLVWIHFASVESTETSYAAIFCEQQLNILFIASLEEDQGKSSANSSRILLS